MGALDPLPKFLKLGQAVFALVAGDDGGIDRADRSADDPVRLDRGFVQRLVNTDLIGAERAAALQDGHDPAVLVAYLVYGLERRPRLACAHDFSPSFA